MKTLLTVFLLAALLATLAPALPAVQADSPAPAPGADLPPGVSADWWAAVQEEIRRSEYDITWQDSTPLPGIPAAYQAPNRAQGLRTYFAPEGIVVVPRVDAEAWRLGLRLAAGGAHGEGAHGGAPLRGEGNRVEYRYSDLTGLSTLSGVVVWYENSEQGLEQRFSLPSPLLLPSPSGRGVGGEGIALEMALDTGLAARLSEDGTAVEFAAAGGAAVARYDLLAVTDAQGQPVAARLEPAGRSLRLMVAGEAAYPLAVAALLHGAAPAPDGLATTPNWTAEGDQNYAYLGRSVGTAGDVNGDGYADVIVGAPNYDNGEAYEGRAFVYHGSAAGLSTTANWTAESNLAYSGFGYAVGTAGDVNGDGYADVIVGAYRYSNGQSNEGRAFAYHGSATGLSTTANWTAESNVASAEFGGSVGTAGDVNGDGYADVIVGAEPYSNGQANEGRAYAYYGSATGLSPTAGWTVESNQASAYYGCSVGTAGDVNGDGYADAIVGSRYYTNDQAFEGRAFVYHGSASGLSATATWTAEGNQVSGNFGYSVGTAGDVNGDGYADVIVGAIYYDGSLGNEGRASVYHGSAAGLSAAANWTVLNDQAGAQFGVSVGTAGDVNGDGYADVIVGAWYYDNGEADEGRAYVYHGSAGGLPAAPAWTAESNLANAYFGRSVGTAGDVNGDGYADVVVGAYYYSNGQTYEGAAYVYHGAPTGLGPAAAWTVEGNQHMAILGYSVDTAGDVNGDGYADVIVGAYAYDNGQTDEGRAFVYHGSAAGLPATANWTAESDQEYAYLGMEVGTAGDVNGDGYADVVVGASRYDHGQANEGSALVYYGSAAGLGPNGTPANADWTAEGDQADALLGYSAGTAGDVNGDGYADVMVGAYSYDNGAANEGRVYVYHGSAGGLSPAPAWQVESDQDNGGMGESIGTAGDVNGDGYDDIIIGARTYVSGDLYEGRAWVYHGSASGLGASAAWIVDGNQADAYLGDSVGTAGDVNGDGYDDVIVGASWYDNSLDDEGRALVYYGSAGGLSPTENWTAESDQAQAYFGSAVGTAGDVNGDGYDDIIVGTYTYDNGQINEGGAFCYYGSAAGLGPNGTPANADWAIESNQANALLGASLGTAGDVNGDGYDDVVVGAYGYDNPSSDEGAAFMYYGNASDGLDLRPQQRRADNSAPAAPGGQSISPTQVRLAALARTPFGRSQVRLQWEVKPEGVPFDGTGLGQSSWQDGGTAGYAFNELVSSLSFETRTHWRVRVAGRPARAAANSAVTYRSRWLHGSTFFTALSGEQSIGGTGQINLLGQAAYANVGAQGTLTNLTLRGYPQTAHWGEAIHGQADLILDRYFTVTPNAGADNFDLTLCLNYDDAELGAVSEASLLLCHWFALDSEYICRPRSASSSTALNLACADNVADLSDWVVAGLGPTAVVIKRFDARPDGGAIHVEWETVSEVNILGFNLYRSESDGGEYVRLNGALIPGQAPGSPGGAVYAWEDGGVQPGVTYYYRLEAVDLSGHGQLYGPVSATAWAPQRICLPLVLK